MWLGMSESTWQPLVPQDIVPFYSTWIGHSAFSFFHCSTRHIRQPTYRTNTPKEKFSSPAEPISSGKLGFQHQVSLSLIWRSLPGPISTHFPSSTKWTFRPQLIPALVARCFKLLSEHLFFIFSDNNPCVSCEHIDNSRLLCCCPPLSFNAWNIWLACILLILEYSTGPSLLCAC